MTRLGWLVALALVGCVVDVDLGRSPQDPPPPDEGPAPDTLVDADPPPPDARPDTATPPPDAAPPDATPPDALPDGPPPVVDCAECVERLAAAADCGEDGPCALDPDLAALCEDACEIPGTADCADCLGRSQALVDLCRQHAPPDACAQLEAALALDCALSCQDAPCADCLAAIEPICAAVGEPCGFALASGFEACFGVCDDLGLFAGQGCAFEVGETWTLCAYSAPEPCDDALALGLDACRRLVTEGCVGCSARVEAEMLSCLNLGFAPDLCIERGVWVERACAVDCVGAPFERCVIGAQADAGLCRATAGFDCEALQQTAIGACLFAEPPVEACLECLASGLAAWEVCGGDAIECLFALEDGWTGCIERCGGAPPLVECFDCAADADAALAECVIAGESLERCLSDRTVAAAGCAPLCGDAIPRAMPCSVRATALAERCLAQPDDPLCFYGPDVLANACRWSRVGWD